MNLKSDDIIRLDIEYVTGEVPPPYSHFYKLRLSFEKKFINTQYEIQYTGREDISTEEIIAEGFSADDDYSFVGEMPTVWEREFKKLYSQSTWSNQKGLSESGGTKILAKDTHGKISRGIPLNQEEWHYFTQEYIQAIYEISKKEAPLTIRYKSIEKENTQFVELTFRFAIRKIDLKINGEQKDLDWEDAKNLLSYIYLPDYDYSLAKENEPTKRGNYIDCGDGFWHEFREGLVNLDESFDAKTKIKEEFNKLNQL